MRSFHIASLLVIASLLILQPLRAQVAAVRFIVKVPSPDSAKKHNVFLAGSFNKWNANDSLYIMNRDDETTYSLVVPLFEGKPYTYKYTLGNWSRVEVKADDSNIANRQVYTKNGMMVTDTVLKWNSPKLQPPPSAQMQKMNAIKDSAGVKLQGIVAKLQVLLKQYNENMLAAKPSRHLHKKINKQITRIFADLYNGIESKIWEIGTSLKPEQKQKILAALKSPGASKDFVNTLKAAYADAMK